MVTATFTETTSEIHVKGITSLKDALDVFTMLEEGAKNAIEQKKTIHLIGDGTRVLMMEGGRLRAA